MLSLICLLVIVLLTLSLIVTNNIHTAEETKKIKTVKNVIVPSIFNEQKYFFISTKYSYNMSFLQAVRSNDYVSNCLINYGIYPECQELYNIFLSSKKIGVFIDLGANIGSCSFLFAKSNIYVYAFEPLQNNLFLFSLTTFANPNYSKYITIYPYAIGKKEENHIMKIVKNNWGYSSLYYNHHDYKEIVHVKMLDDFNKIIPKHVSILKIDVEGSEYDVFEGGKNFFANHKIEYIFMETECGKKNNFGEYEIEKMFILLNELGYEIIKKFNCTKVSKHNILAKHRKI